MISVDLRGSVRQLARREFLESKGLIGDREACQHSWGRLEMVVDGRGGKVQEVKRRVNVVFVLIFLFYVIVYQNFYVYFSFI